jgi:hypothetical protein
MTAITNPALQKFAGSFGDELVIAQVLIRRQQDGFELRHTADRSRVEVELRAVPLAHLRELAQFTEKGAFRPLKSAPNLRSGWRTSASNDAELGEALNQLYPGAVADWFAVQSAVPPVTHYREFTGRQTGMYRITTLLSDEQAARMSRACCHAAFCLKRRLWTVPGLLPDSVAEKSMIPCLEPCAVLLEFARKVARLEQEDRHSTAVGSGELATLIAALEHLLENSGATVREADFSAPTNPRRVRWLLERWKPLLADTPDTVGGEEK